ncbi:hypothetical protein GCM10009779_01080 [Polymorphospora rubra]
MSEKCATRRVALAGVGCVDVDATVGPRVGARMAAFRQGSGVRDSRGWLPRGTCQESLPPDVSLIQGGSSLS